jgi:hypothetical protein
MHHDDRAIVAGRRPRAYRRDVQPTALMAIAIGLVITAAGCPGKRRPGGPPADCGDVAESLVSIELGNHAPVEERAKLLPAKRALCEQQRIIATEAACLARASDPGSAARCVPRLFPHVETSNCEPVIAKLRAMIAAQTSGAAAQPELIEKIVGVFARSCAEDGWPEAMHQCLLAAAVDRPEAMQACELTMPPGVKDKIQARMAALMP